MCTARARRAVVASMDPMQRAARHAMPMAGTTALQDLLAEVAGRRREAHDTAARIRDLARARRAAVLAARVMGGAWTTHVRRVTLLLAGETAPRPQWYYRVTLGGRVIPSPAIRRLTACVIAGCVGHASVHCDSGPRAWGPGERARCVFHSSSTMYSTGQVHSCRTPCRAESLQCTTMKALPAAPRGWR